MSQIGSYRTANMEAEVRRPIAATSLYGSTMAVGVPHYEVTLPSSNTISDLSIATHTLQVILSKLPSNLAGDGNALLIVVSRHFAFDSRTICLPCSVHAIHTVEPLESSVIFSSVRCMLGKLSFVKWCKGKYYFFPAARQCYISIERR